MDEGSDDQVMALRGGAVPWGYLGASASKKSMQRFKTMVGETLVYGELGWALSISNACPDHIRRGPHVKPVGERNAGNPHVVFDERGEETSAVRTSSQGRSKRSLRASYRCPGSNRGPPDLQFV